jgi:hypothetical protein
MEALYDRALLAPRCFLRRYTPGILFSLLIGAAVYSHPVPLTVDRWCRVRFARPT